MQTTRFPAPDADQETPPDAVAFILRLGKALHHSGYAAHRLEAILERAAVRLGISAQFFSTPTSIFSAFGPLDRQRTHLMRVEPGGQDLGRLADLDGVIGDVLRSRIPLAEGAARIEAIIDGPPRYGRLLTGLAFGVASAASARFLGGGLLEVVVSGALGLVIGMVALLAARFQTVDRVFEPFAAFLASLGTAAVAVWVAPLSVPTAVLASLIVLIPGLTLTVAMTELASRHLVSGISRLSGALMLFLAIAFGVALGQGVVVRVAGHALPAAASIPLPGWTEPVALVVAALSFTILLSARASDTGWILLSGSLAIWCSRLGAIGLGPELGSFAGALAVGVSSNLIARLRDQPSQVTLVPGILFLVPGSVGVRGLFSMLDQEVIHGVEAAFQMLLIAAAIVAGLLIANVLTPSRELPEVRRALGDPVR